MKIVVIDPRRTATCEFADLHLPVRAGTDVWLFNGLLAFLHQHGAVATQFVERSTSGVDKALLVAEKTAGSVREVARTCAQLGLQVEARGEGRVLKQNPSEGTEVSTGQLVYERPRGLFLH